MWLWEQLATSSYQKCQRLKRHEEYITYTTLVGAAGWPQAMPHISRVAPTSAYPHA